MRALVVAVALMLGVGARASTPPPPPQGAAAVQIFADQLPDRLSPGLLRFAAAHYVGAVKLGRSVTVALHRLQPRFVALQYRLALGLGYRTTDADCQPRGTWIRVRKGDEWMREWPAHVPEHWLFHEGGSRVLSCWGWYLVDPDDAGWRAYYLRELRSQVASTDADGAFLDTARPPAAIARPFRPRLPTSRAFTEAWERRLERFLHFVRAGLHRPVVANAGSLLAGDLSGYAAVDGVMVEPFALDHSGRPLPPASWRRQVRRVLALERSGLAVLAQAYPSRSDRRGRMFVLASYLLTRGVRTTLNFFAGTGVAWFPEYDVDLGAPAKLQPSSLRELEQGGVYVRRYARGLVVVNASATRQELRLDSRYERLLPIGGGEVPDDGRLPPAWRLTRTPVQLLRLRPHEGAVLLLERPS
jgi:hypothetical protein